MADAHHVAVAQAPRPVTRSSFTKVPLRERPSSSIDHSRPTRSSLAWVRDTRSSHSIGDVAGGAAPDHRGDAVGGEAHDPLGARPRLDRTRKGSPAASASRTRIRSFGSVGQDGQSGTFRLSVGELGGTRYRGGVDAHT